jgi:hypothetical protein
VILLDFAFLWNGSWVRNSETASDAGDEKTALGWILGLLLSTVTLYAGTIALLAFLYRWYVPHTECHENAWFVSVSLVLIFCFTAASLHPLCAEKGRYFPLNTHRLPVYCPVWSTVGKYGPHSGGTPSQSLIHSTRD